MSDTTITFPKTLTVDAGRILVDEHQNVVATVHSWHRLGIREAYGLANVITPTVADRLVHEMALRWNGYSEAVEMANAKIAELTAAYTMLNEARDCIRDLCRVMNEQGSAMPDELHERASRLASVGTTIEPPTTDPVREFGAEVLDILRASDSWSSDELEAISNAAARRDLSLDSPDEDDVEEEHENADDGPLGDGEQRLRALERQDWLEPVEHPEDLGPEDDR